ncbi:transporter substrate-binding domain-containing protein [Agrobacterium rhizogenes]|uniref:transporter substrate-binding domain-containing protein n=1 Tax=Rhizobium rhizogenes TaxID=359 RepID=UPI00157461C5|nr:transporter substrate-binding domain-containing protein [Rhizobium rhizogenes]NTI18071.1 transporter substrate-binding domain-containing protein [Rhizobium rhizogenes]NTI37397.1 transporter substrate-binding domain-containing protein [Rhizobium rhizogenes]WEO68601.1 transporter substrate-binding domain-containing protein [Rhizobium rhizogenes]
MTEDVTGRRAFLTAAALGGGAAVLVGGATAAVAQTASAPGTLQAIRDRGELRIAVAPGEPWFYKDQRSGEWYGLGWGVGVALAKELGIKATPVETTWGTAIAGLQAGQFDVMFTMDATPQRALAADFPVQPMFYYAQGVLLKDGVTVTTWEEMNKPEFKIGVVLGTSPDRDITVRLPKATIERFPSADETGAAFVAGRMDAISLFHPALVMLQSKVTRGSIVLPEPIRQSPSSAGVPNQADKSWRDWLGLSMDYLYQTGQTQKIFDEYLTYRGIDASKVPAIMRERWTKA